MKFEKFAGFVLSTHLVAGHYVFSKLSLNDGPISEVFKYVRPLHAGPNYGGSYYTNYAPIYDTYSENIRCGWGGAAMGKGIETLPVNAGDTITFYSTQFRDGAEQDEKIYHEGPGQAYLSKVEDGDLETNRGDGDWFRIGSHGALNDTHWKLYNQESMNITIPKTTPPGKYLLRAEHAFYYNSLFNSTQFYVSCAHVDISGPGGGTPGPLVKFPGAYDMWDRTLWQPFRISSHFTSLYIDLSKLVTHGPAVWTG